MCIEDNMGKKDFLKERVKHIYIKSFDSSAIIQSMRDVSFTTGDTARAADIWQKKYSIITEVYGFGADSFEARTTPHQEAFWIFGGRDTARKT